MGEVVYGTSHIRSLLGILKICEILACLLAVILVAVDNWSNALIKAIYAGTIIGIIVSLVILVISATEAGHSLNGVLKFQFAIHLLLCIYLLIVSSVLLGRYGSYNRTHRAGGVFGLIASFFYLCDAGLSYKSYGIRF